MSLETWKKEFYPIPADKVKSHKKAVEHSILKWTGLFPKNLKKHNIYKTKNTGIYEPPSITTDEDNYNFVIDCSTCALCCLVENDRDVNCDNCKIVKVTGKRCDNPWIRWRDKTDPKPMLKVLRKVLRSYK